MPSQEAIEAAVKIANEVSEEDDTEDQGPEIPIEESDTEPAPKTPEPPPPAAKKELESEKLLKLEAERVRRRLEEKREREEFLKEKEAIAKEKERLKAIEEAKGLEKLKALGLSYEEITKQILAEGTPEAELLREREESKKELAAIKAEMQALKEERETQAAEAAKRQHEQQVFHATRTFISSITPEECPYTCTVYEPHETASIAQRLAAEYELPDDELRQAIEGLAKKEYDRMQAAQKRYQEFQKLKGVPSKAAENDVESEEDDSIGQSDRPQPKTLTNRLASEPSTPARSSSWEERKKAAMRLVSGA